MYIGDSLDRYLLLLLYICIIEHGHHALGDSYVWEFSDRPTEIRLTEEAG